MFKRKILFFIVFLTIPLSSCSLRKNDTKINQIENQKTPEAKNISNVLRGKGKETLGEELNINETSFKPNKSMEMRIDNNQQVKSLENYRKNFYINFSIGYSSLKNYDV